MKTKLLAAIAIGAMTFGAGPALAQSLDNEPDSFQDQVTTTDRPLPNAVRASDVDPANPFGDLQVDMTRDIEPGEFDEIQLAELRQRCEFIMDNPQTYGPKPASFCEGKVDGLTQ